MDIDQSLCTTESADSEALSGLDSPKDQSELTEEEIETVHILIETQLQQGNFEQVRALGEDLEKANCRSPWLSRHLGRAHFGLRQMELAQQHLWASLPAVPRNDHVMLALYSLEAGNECFSPEEHLEELALHGVTQHSFIDGLAPVFFDARPVTCAFLDQFSIVSHTGSPAGDESLRATADLDTVPWFIRVRMAFLELARYLYGHFGIYTAYMRYPEFSGDRCYPLAKVFFSKDASLIEQVTALQSGIWKEMTESDATTQIRTQSLVPEGKLLGYPDCCVEWATAMRSQQDPYERHAIHALLEQEDVLETGTIDLRPDPAYFAFEFYPCHPQCKAAVDQGLEIWKSYKAIDEELASLYRDYALRLNKARIVWLNETYEGVMSRFHTPADTE